MFVVNGFLHRLKIGGILSMKNKYSVSRKLLNKFRSNFTILVVELVIDFGGRILLIKRKEEPLKGQWFIPGRRIYKEEDTEKAAIRVAKEETGLDCKIIRQLPSSREIYHAQGTEDGVYDTYGVVFLMKPINKRQKVCIDNTSSDYMFTEKIESGFNPHLKKILKNSGIFKL